MDINKALRSAVSTGKVYFGAEQTTRAVQAKEVKLLIIASNYPKEDVNQLNSISANIPSYTYNGDNMELGAACGKPFAVSVISIIEEGDSGILALRD